MVLAQLAEDEIKKIADTAGATIHKQILMYLSGIVTKDAIIDYLDVYGNGFATFRHFTEGKRNTLMVYHGINRQFSLLYADIEAIEREKDINDEGFSIVFES